MLPPIILRESGSFRTDGEYAVTVTSRWESLSPAQELVKAKAGVTH